MKELLSQLAITVNEGRHIFEYEAIQLDWWDQTHPINYEIELIFGDDANILLFYFVPHIEGIVERSLILVVETSREDDTLLDSLLAEEVKNEVFPNTDLTYDEDEGGFHLTDMQQAIQAVSHFMNQLSEEATVMHSELPEAELADDSAVEYEVGDTISHFIAMYFMNNESPDQQTITSYLQFAEEVEGTDYTVFIKQDIQQLQAENNTLRDQLINGQEELTENPALLDLFIQAVEAF